MFADFKSRSAKIRERILKQYEEGEVDLEEEEGEGEVATPGEGET